MEEDRMSITDKAISLHQLGNYTEAEAYYIQALNNSNDTNVHIAGALGIKTWCLTPHNPDWPWGLINNHCKWYPAVKLIRQKNGNWKSTFSEIAYLLKNTY